MTTTSTRPEMPTAAPKQRDFRQEVTDNIVRMLEQGVAPWQKPWEPREGSLGIPLNPTTERPYRGGNAIHLMTTALSRGYDDPRWMTYKQAAQEGWQVRAGEKGTQVEFWEMRQQEAAKAEPEKIEKNSSAKNESGRSNNDRARWVHRVYTIFNASQIDGIPPLIPKVHSSFEVIQAGEEILKSSGATIRHDQADRAFYSRSSDSVHLPPKDSFKEAPGYYGTALHELAHWTGHPDRLNRSTLTEAYRFGDTNYAKEELRAELASVFLAAERGIPHDPQQHAAYVSHWIKALKEDKNEIFRAAHDASVAADFLLALERDKSRADQALATNSQISPITGSSKEASLEDQATDLNRNRDLAEEAVSVHEPEPALSNIDPRESTTQVARLEPDSGTVNVHEKHSATDRRTPVAQTLSEQRSTEKSVNGQDRDSQTERSLADAKAITFEALGKNAKVHEAEVQSGVYRGPIIGLTNEHIIQRVSARSAIAHPIELLDTHKTIGSNLTINYSNEVATVREIRERSKARDLGR